MNKWFPTIVVLLAVLWLASLLPPPRSKPGFDFQNFGKLPVLLSGRTQPIDSMARNSLLILRGKQTVALPGTNSLSAIEWLAEVVFDGAKADTRPVFRIDHPELRGLLGLSDEEKFFSFNQFFPKLASLEKETKRIREEDIKQESQTPFEKAVVRLDQNYILYRRLKNTFSPEDTKDFAADLVAYQAAIPAGVQAIRDRESGKTPDQKAFDTILEHLQRYDRMSQMGYALAVPSGSPNHDRDDWSNVGVGVMEVARGGEMGTPILAYANLASSFQAGQADRFNTALQGYRSWMSEHGYDVEVTKGYREHYFSFLEPFYRASLLYVLIFVFACISWFNRSTAFSGAAYRLLLLAWIVHTAGLIYRMVLEGRPPVTNLYSSAIFIGWGIVGLGILLEKLHRNAIGSVVAAIGGGTTLVVAHHLSMDGDTMEMMRAVLDTNFWLATHVVTVTLGYSATFMAGFLATLYILRGVLTSSLTKEMASSLSRMVYGIICFATLLSFVGTVLGGIWADQSWGRFWGWDPKENGALMIVLWNAFYLHGRWGKVFSEKTLMAVAVFGNIITAFSWFGVNMLGIGLHSYGFMGAAFTWLILFDISQLLILGLGLLPLSWWRSFRPTMTGGASTLSGRGAVPKVT